MLFDHTVGRIKVVMDIGKDSPFKVKEGYASVEIGAEKVHGPTVWMDGERVSRNTDCASEFARSRAKENRNTRGGHVVRKP